MSYENDSFELCDEIRKLKGQDAEETSVICVHIRIIKVRKVKINSETPQITKIFLLQVMLVIFKIFRTLIPIRSLLF